MLPDGRKIVVGNERFKCAEVLFKPEIAGIDIDGIHKYIYNSVMKCDIDVRRDLL